MGGMNTMSAPAANRRRRSADEYAEMTDIELCDAAREEDFFAFQELYTRYLGLARSSATRFVGHSNSEDLVADAFESIFAALRKGSGPTEGFNAYLMMTLRRGAARMIDRLDRQTPTADIASAISRAEDSMDPSAEDLALAEGDREIIRTAYRALAPLSRKVLWLVDVERMRYSEAATALAMTSRSLDNMLRRARKELATQYVLGHLGSEPIGGDHPSDSQLVRLVSGGLRGRSLGSMEHHLESCLPCTDKVLELRRQQEVVKRLGFALPLAAFAPLLDVVGHGPKVPPVSGWWPWSALGAVPKAAVVGVLGLVVVGGLVGVLYEDDQSASPAPTSSAIPGAPGAAPGESSGPASGGPSGQPSVVDGAPSTSVSVAWSADATVAGAAVGEVVALPFEISVGSMAGHDATLTILDAPGIEIFSAYATCDRVDTGLVCPHVGPLADGTQTSGKVLVRVDGPAAQLPQISIRPNT